MKSKQTSIATVRYHLRTLVSFSIPLFFNWSLPFRTFTFVGGGFSWSLDVLHGGLRRNTDGKVYWSIKLECLQRGFWFFEQKIGIFSTNPDTKSVSGSGYSETVVFYGCVLQPFSYFLFTLLYNSKPKRITKTKKVHLNSRAFCRKPCCRRSPRTSVRSRASGL